jgi:hypothetical protein
MAIDPEDLQDLQEIMAENFTDKANIFRKQSVNPGGDVNYSDSDGMGGASYHASAVISGDDVRTKIYSEIPCRVTVPRANRSDAEYSQNDALVTESRCVICFAHNTDLREGDRVDVKFRGKFRMYEVQVIADHAESYSLQANCVELQVQKSS